MQKTELLVEYSRFILSPTSLIKKNGPIHNKKRMHRYNLTQRKIYLAGDSFRKFSNNFEVL